MDALKTSPTHQIARQMAGYLGEHQYRFTLGGQPVAPEQAVDAVILQGQKVRGLSPDGQTNEYLVNPERLRFFLARQAGMSGMPEAEIHRLVEGPADDARQLDAFEQLAQAGVKYRTAMNNDIPSAPGLIPYLAERSGRNLQIFVPGATDGRPVQNAQQLQTVLRAVGLMAADPLDSKRQANVQTLLDAGFGFKGTSRLVTAQDICLAQSAGESILFTMPGGQADHHLPTCANWDAEGMVGLSEVRRRGMKLLQGDTPLRQGSVELHHAQQIAGEYTDTTLEGYLKAMTGNPDAEFAETAKTSLRQQTELMTRRLHDLENQARQDALEEMSVQTQFLSDALGSTSESWPFSSLSK
ncbi:MAG TPA: hypothetical protein VGO93_07990 [Candidatus Xenobia bacterium]|jgi:hypothetical protein